MRKRSLLFALEALLIAGTISLAANIPLLTGPAGSNPPAEMPPGLGTINQVIQSINGGTGGLLNAQTAAVATGAGTAEQTLQTFSLPANTLTTAGQSLRVVCWGPTAANTNNKTARLYFGASVVATPTMATSAERWSLDILVMRRTATTQGFLGNGAISTGPVPIAPIVTDGAETLTAAVTIKCTGQDGTDSAGDITANGMIVTAIK